MQKRWLFCNYKRRQEIDNNDILPFRLCEVAIDTAKAVASATAGDCDLALPPLESRAKRVLMGSPLE